MSFHPSVLAPAGVSVAVEPGLRRILAPNPSAFTGPGTNSYIVGHGRVALIDPGPDDTAHLEAVLAALGPGERVEAIVITHSHRDHSAILPRLRERVDAPVLAFGTSDTGRNPALVALAGLGGGEGVDHDFAPDRLVQDGEHISGPDWELGVIHTPGHFGNHICLSFGDTILSGDQAMGWSTSIVSPPDGDMGDYMASLDRLLGFGAARLHPGHGEPVADATARLLELRDHRLGRERQVLLALEAEGGRAEDLARRIYNDIAPGLIPAASRNVLAHLLDLSRRGLVQTGAEPGPQARWTLV